MTVAQQAPMKSPEPRIRPPEANFYDPNEIYDREAHLNPTADTPLPHSFFPLCPIGMVDMRQPGGARTYGEYWEEKRLARFVKVEEEDFSDIPWKRYISRDEGYDIDAETIYTESDEEEEQEAEIEMAAEVEVEAEIEIEEEAEEMSVPIPEVEKVVEEVVQAEVEIIPERRRAVKTEDEDDDEVLIIETPLPVQRLSRLPPRNIFPPSIISPRTTAFSSSLLSNPIPSTSRLPFVSRLPPSRTTHTPLNFQNLSMHNSNTANLEPIPGLTFITQPRVASPIVIDDESMADPAESVIFVDPLQAAREDIHMNEDGGSNASVSNPIIIIDEEKDETAAADTTEEISQVKLGKKVQVEEDDEDDEDENLVIANVSQNGKMIFSNCLPISFAKITIFIGIQAAFVSSKLYSSPKKATQAVRGKL